MTDAALLPAVQRRLSSSDVTQVRELLDAATAADHSPPLSDHVMLHLPGGGDADVRHLLVHASGSLVGYAHLDVTDQVEGPSAELVVHPDWRNRGIGRALAAELIRQSSDGRLRLWAHGMHPAAEKMAAAGGFTRSRVLWQMRRSLRAPLPPYRVPEGVAVRTFADHPDQGRWSVEDVRVREREAWFDPEGFFLAFRGDRLVGFHWTKVHGTTHEHDGDHHVHVHDALGEVYVVGVDPSEQGHGLGPALTLLGLHHLHEKGLPSVMLYVDETNTNAIRVYERLGFVRHSTDVCYAFRP